ncbi:MAG: hypothetical protein ACOZAN_00510 [Patescibacteria group bacterium]
MPDSLPAISVQSSAQNTNSLGLVKAKDDKSLKSKSQQFLAAISFAGQVAMNNPSPVNPTSVQAQEQEKPDPLTVKITQEEHQEIIGKMVSYVNMPAGHLKSDDELYLEQQLADMLGFEVTAELDGHRLNHTIGIMGSEQHLKRYPGDTLDQHDAYQEAGIAPNRGAFGWFLESGELTKKAIEREKYYFAVQLMYLPDWNENYPELKPWYKYRKMVVINPAEEVAVVGVVADAGPAMWVKKQSGGSPEVIREGKIWSPKTKGKVMLLFVDDPEDKIPLGPISLKWEDKQQLASQDNSFANK